MAKQTQKRQAFRVAKKEWPSVYEEFARTGKTYLDLEAHLNISRTYARTYGKYCVPDAHKLLMLNYWAKRQKPWLLDAVAREELKGTTNKEMTYLFGFTSGGMCNWRKRNRAKLNFIKETYKWQNSPSP